MKLGLILPNYGREATRYSIIDTALAAETLGYDSIWLTDHLALPQQDSVRFGHIYEAMTSLAYLSASTRIIKLGISALVLPQRNPVEVAKSLATLDILSSGRILLSAGVGWSKGEYENLGYDFHNRGKRMDEALQVLRTIWRGQSKVSYKGKFYNFENMFFSPGPVQSGGPPIWVAGNSMAALKRAVFLADGWHPNASSPENLKSSLDQVKVLLLNRSFTVSVRFRLDYNQQTESENILSGSTENIIKQLKSYQSSGMNYALINILATTQAERERFMKQFIQEIKPELL
jgi:probable F420-dependent oxidoreductase